MFSKLAICQGLSDCFKCNSYKDDNTKCSWSKGKCSANNNM